MNLCVGVLAFISEYLDAGLGMGYGTALAPILIMLGYAPLHVVPAILISQCITDIAAVALHHRARNCDVSFGSADLRIAALLGGISSVGVMTAVIVAVRIPKQYLILYIGLLVTAMGLLILRRPAVAAAVSWKKIVGISFLAAFNKGISGGGYGPLVMGGQLLSGVSAKHAVGITALAEAMTCVVGFAAYLVLGKTINWSLTLMLVVCALPAVPVAVYSVTQVNAARLRLLTGVFITLLGVCTVLKISAGS